MAGLSERVAAFIATHDLLRPGDRVLVGVSGGADSLALAHILHTLNRYHLHIATLDHGIRGPVGAADAAFVQSVARRWGLPVTVGRADVPALADAHRLGLEEAARQVRYTFLLRAARQIGADCIAVGHNQDDQAETVLMHLIRGSGLGGLRGMLPRTALSTYHLLDDATIIFAPEPSADVMDAAPPAWPPLIRPLLSTPRAAIEAYAARHDLQPRHDATNTDLTYFRNRLRHEVLPLLATLNPNIRATLARTAEVLRGDAALVESAGQAALARVVEVARDDALFLDGGVWRALMLPEKRYVLRAGVFRLRPALRDVSLAYIDAAIAVADRGAPATAATLPGDLLLRVGRGVLSLGAAGDPPLLVVPGIDAPALAPGWESGVFLPDAPFEYARQRWAFRAEPRAALPTADQRRTLHETGLAAVLWVPGDAWLQLRAWQPGDRFAPRGLGGTQKLVATFGAMQVPAPWRQRVPVLTVDGAPAWFVAPAPRTLRSRVAAHVAIPDDAGTSDKPVGRVVVVVRWQAIDPASSQPPDV